MHHCCHDHYSLFSGWALDSLTLGAVFEYHKAGAQRGGGDAGRLPELQRRQPHRGPQYRQRHHQRPPTLPPLLHLRPCEGLPGRPEGQHQGALVQRPRRRRHRFLHPILLPFIVPSCQRKPGIAARRMVFGARCCCLRHRLLSRGVKA